jgi:nitrate/TMAO reductase-like tetraheme cytochrome c subunit
MSNPENSNRVSRLSVFRNWLSLSGFVIVLGSLFAFLLLFVVDTLASVSNPYIGILTYFVAPGFTVLGLALAITGALFRRRRLAKQAALAPVLTIDLTRPRDRKLLGYFLAGSTAFLLITAIGTYHTYQFTESVAFCGRACHTVMEPEMVAYGNGSHARVACAECHIGPGATWYVRSKLSGAYQVYATLANKYPRPIPTPISNLRPAQETCEQCHWPQKFVGNLDRTLTHFLGDATNTVYQVRLLLKVGGADPTHGPVEGIHWHMNVANKVEYVATDAGRQTIPWVRLTDSRGVVTEFRSTDFTNKIDRSAIRRMDCIDCHNRPAHVLQSPNDAVDLAMTVGQIDTTLPFVKTNALYALTRNYTNRTDALQGIATFLAYQYPGKPSINRTIASVQGLYTNNFFPEMRANWRVYPNNIGHKDWPGCFRCHDGKHQTADGTRMIKANDCNACHKILAQGSGKDLEHLTPQGQEFQHPGGELEKGFLCNDCHTGGP